MERAEIFVRARIGIDSIIEANRTDRQLVAQARSDRITHIVEANVLGGRQKIARISEYCGLQFSQYRKGVFNFANGVKFCADGMTMIIVRANFAFDEAAHGFGAAIEE